MEKTPRERTNDFVNKVIDARIILKEIDELHTLQIIKKIRLTKKYKAILKEIKSMYPQYIFDQFIL